MKLIQFNLNLLSFYVERMLIDATGGLDLRGFRDDKLYVDTSIEAHPQKDSEIIFFVVDLTYRYSPEAERHHRLFNIRIPFEFYVEQLWQYVKDEDNNVRLHPGLLTALASISLSTARGVAKERSQGHFVSKFHLPIINIPQFVKDTDLYFQPDEEES